MDPLRQDLCRLAMALEPSSIRLLLAGGYGILLKAEYLVHTGAETVASTSFPRATRDLDLVLTSEIIADAGKLTTVREALKHLGYEPLAGREHYQWGRVTEDEGRETPIKIDLMGQIPEDRRGMSIRARRMRPHGFKGLHAHPMKEAGLIHLGVTPIAVCADRSTGEIGLPHPFNYMLLKLFAFSDRKHDDTVDLGRHHAFDLYRIVAMMTRAEWQEVKRFRAEYSDAAIVQNGVQIVRSEFSGEETLGTLRLREYVRGARLSTDSYPVGDFLTDLRELWLGGLDHASGSARAIDGK